MCFLLIHYENPKACSIILIFRLLCHFHFIWAEFIRWFLYCYLSYMFWNLSLPAHPKWGLCIPFSLCAHPSLCAGLAGASVRLEAQAAMCVLPRTPADHTTENGRPCHGPVSAGLRAAQLASQVIAAQADFFLCFLSWRWGAGSSPECRWCSWLTFSTPLGWFRTLCCSGLACPACLPVSDPEPLRPKDTVLVSLLIYGSVLVFKFFF